ncbi:MAG: phosphate ABC transporter permease subunit PstC [Saprospiraceae bacterium]|nr:phosphate ABC transporter permease subunit PstC [Saprospiraceae bacterium]
MSRVIKEKIIEILLALSAWLTIATTIAIIIILFSESIGFFEYVSVWDFITGKEWTPLFEVKKFGILPLLSGTIVTSTVAILIALPIGLTIAIYLSEYAGQQFRTIIKPLLEILAAVPTVVYGFFALTVVTPFLKEIFPSIGTFNGLSAGLVMGIMIIPMISSLSEDALYAVPKPLRDGSYGLGATRFQTAFKVLVPAASSGIIVSVILAISRAIGETMIVAIAAGQQPNLTFNPLEAMETITAYIVQVSLGDVPHGSVAYKTIFATALFLFIFTFLLNNISFYVIRKYREKYD